MPPASRREELATAALRPGGREALLVIYTAALMRILAVGWGGREHVWPGVSLDALRAGEVLADGAAVPPELSVRLRVGAAP